MDRKKKAIIITLVVAIIIAIAVGIIIFVINKIKLEHRKYEISKIDNYDYFLLYEDKKFGVIDKYGNIVIEPQYDIVKIPNPQEKVFVCYQGDNIKIVNEKNEKLYSQYEKTEPIKLNSTASDLVYEKTVLKYKKDGKYGLIDFSGNEITKPIYDEITSFEYREGELLVKENGKYGVINIRGYEMIHSEYDEILDDKYIDNDNSYKTSGYIVGKKENNGYSYGYINYNGEEILKIQYETIKRVVDVGDKDNIYLIVSENGRYGVLKNKDKIINNEYQEIEYNDETKTFTVNKGSKYGVINLDGNIILDIKNEKIIAKGIYLYTVNGEERVAYNNDGSVAKIDSNVTVLNTENSKYFISIKSNENGDLYGVLDNDNNKLIPENYLYLEYAYGNYFIACTQNRKLGIIDNQNNIVLEFNYDIIQKIKNKNIIQATISKTNMTEIYSEKMEKICEMYNAKVINQDKFIRVISDTQQYYFDDKGNEISNTKFLKAELFSAVINEKWGFVDNQNTVKVECKYDKVTEFNKYGYAGIFKNGKWGVIDSKGNVIIEPTYELNKNKEPNFVGKYYEVQYGYGEVYYTDGK